MVRIPASWVTRSGWPARLETSSDGSSSVARIATDPEITRTLSAATSPSSRVLGESMVQRGIAVLPRALTHPGWAMRPCCGRVTLIRYIVLATSQDVSRVPRPREVRQRRRAGRAGRGARSGGAGVGGLGRSPLVLVVQAREPAGQAVDRRLRVGMQVDELAQPLGQPAQRDLVFSAPVRELLQPAVGEVHESSASPAGTAPPTGPSRRGGPAPPPRPRPRPPPAARRPGATPAPRAGRGSRTAAGPCRATPPCWPAPPAPPPPPPPPGTWPSRPRARRPAAGTAARRGLSRCWSGPRR